jgi:hypothetical protein
MIEPAEVHIIGGMAKGSVLLHLKDFVHKFHGASTWQGLLLDMPTRERGIIGGIVLAGAWYPVEVWNEVLDLFLPQCYASPEDGMVKLAGYIAENDLNTVYKMILKMGTPEFLMKRTSSLWSRYFDKGRLSSEEVAPRRWKLQLDLPDTSGAVPSYFTCGPGVAAWITNGLQTTGVDGKVTFSTGLKGNQYNYEARW